MYSIYYIAFQGHKKAYGKPEELKIQLKAESALSLRRKIGEYFAITGRVELLEKEAFEASPSREVGLADFVPSTFYVLNNNQKYAELGI